MRKTLRLTALFFCFVSASAFAQSNRYIFSCSVLNSPNTTYILQNDVSSSGTCMSVQADNVTLDLGGHTVNYGSLGALQAQRRYGVLAEACWDTAGQVGDNPCGGSFLNLLVKNGSIVQSAGAGPYSHGIRVGQGAGVGFKLQGVNITVSSANSIPVYTEAAQGAMDIGPAVLTSNVTQITSRVRLEGMHIKLSSEFSTAPADKIHDVKLIGGSQGGIFATGPGTQIYNNDISLKGTYTNDFGIFLWSPNATAYNNNIHGQSRGILLYGTSNRAYNNTIDVHEVNQNIEYGGCELSGAFGIQMESTSRYGLVTGNQVTTSADLCDGRTFRATENPTGNGDVSRGNYYRAVRVGTSSKLAIAASFSQAYSILMDGDTLEADTANTEIPWGGAQDITLKNVTFIKGSNPASNYATFRFTAGDNYPLTSTRRAYLTVQDGKFLNGASPDSYLMYPIGYAQAIPSWYTVQWTYNLTVRNAAGVAISGAAVTVTDNTGAVQTRTTDASGRIVPLLLTQFRRYNTTTGIVKDSRTYTVKVASVSCSKTAPLSIAGTTSATITMPCN